ncbi:NAD-dependent epimerase/dehydratase family protein [Amycolatopsis magusensis]|uniref:Nucleoside-diphosphate-sugar epimerase n=1 Tax=Amycolatopsis magusensis TaxID=882444 RepID=A0ABS4PNW2_9PSEU|nr:NAD-dependent epimerase/dehydratase family protein [Amycolatopsis magusensis]MBP2181082.1 nucleoside-diphosphate-sugar epimerase [Amycolatopsis magusensis]
MTVTGGTGFAGAHSVAAITARGHRVRLLARDPASAGPALEPLGVDPGAVEVVAGDVTDEAAVAAAVRGADAVLHAAAVYSFDSRQRAVMRAVNERGTEVVLAAARRAGAGRIVHVSSVAALFPSREPLGPDSPVGEPREAYMATKAAAEVVARRHQAEGAPVVITYPPAMLGPHDPKLGDQNARLRNVLRGLMPFWPRGGLPMGDVRDTAELHARVLTDFPGSNRVFGPGRAVSTRDYVAAVREVTGRALPALFLPPAALVPVGRLADLAQRVWPWRIPAEYGAIYACACDARVGDAVPTAGLSPRPLAATLTDAVRWLHRAGHLSDRQAGVLGTPVPMSLSPGRAVR